MNRPGFGSWNRGAPLSPMRAPLLGFAVPVPDPVAAWPVAEVRL